MVASVSEIHHMKCSFLEFQVISHDSAEHSLKSGGNIFNTEVPQNSSKAFMVVVDCPYFTIRVDVESCEAVYYAKHLFLDLAVTFFSFGECS